MRERPDGAEDEEPGEPLGQAGPAGPDDASASGSPEPAERGTLPDDDEVPGGIFRSWRALYVTLLVYTGVAIAVLLFLTRFLNAGGP